MTQQTRVLWTLIAILAILLVMIARQHTSKETALVSTHSASTPEIDTSDVMGTQRLLAVAQTAEIASLQQELHDVELTSRSVGLLSLKPGNWRNGWMATFYDGSEGINGTGTRITASGQPVASDWTAAADPRLLPLGTIIEVRLSSGETKLLQITDTGGAIKGRRLDIYVPDKAECMRLGRQMVRIRVLRMAG